MPSLIAYIGLTDDSQLSLFVAPTKLAPFGARLLRGRPFSKAILDFYHMTLEEQEKACGQTIRSAQNFLEGKEAGTEQAIFGETSIKKTRKRS